MVRRAPGRQDFSEKPKGAALEEMKVDTTLLGARAANGGPSLAFTHVSCTHSVCQGHAFTGRRRLRHQGPTKRRPRGNACMLRKGLRACTSALLGRPGSTSPPGRAQPAQHARCSAACRPAARAGTHLGAMPRQRQAPATRPSPMLAPRSKCASGGAPASQGGGGCGAVRLTRAVWGAQA